MVLLLSLDVIYHAVLISTRHRERSITILPVPERRKDGVLLNPFARTDFNLLYEVGKRHRRMKAGQNVDVVLDTINAIQVRFLVLQNAPEVTIQVFTPVGIQARNAVFCREHDVVIDLGVGGHLGSTPRPSLSRVRPFQGR